MGHQMKSAQYFQRTNLAKGQKNRQYEMFKEEYERIDILDDHKIKIRIRKVRLEKLRREIEEINKFHLKRHRIIPKEKTCSKTDEERLGDMEKSRTLGQYYSMRNSKLREESKPMRKKMLQNINLNPATDSINLQFAQNNNDYSEALALSENVYFIDLGAAAFHKLEACGKSGGGYSPSMPKITEQPHRAVNNWRKLATSLTICKQVKAQESSSSKLIRLCNENESHQLKTKILSNRQAAQTGNEADQFSHCLPNSLLNSTDNNQTYSTKPINRVDFNSSYKPDSKQLDTFSFGKLRQIFEHENQLLTQ